MNIIILFKRRSSPQSKLFCKKKIGGFKDFFLHVDVDVMIFINFKNFSEIKVHISYAWNYTNCLIYFNLSW